MRIAIRWPIAAALCLAFTVAAQAAEIKLISSGALKETLQDLLPQFEKASEHKVMLTLTGTAGVVKRMREGEQTDLVILADYALEGLIKDGKVAAGSRTDMTRSGVGIAIKAGAPKPDVSSAEALKRTLIAAKSIAHSKGPSGIYLASLFKKLGIADEIKGKVKEIEGEPVGAVVARGDAEIGFQQISEIIHVPGAELLGPLPADVQHMTVFSLGLSANAKEADAAKALVKFLTGPAAPPVLKKNGLEPG
jgi:molybdate transport system substrate-binding protein